MSTKKKILLGGLGALTPVILNLIAVDVKVLLQGLTLAAIIGYLVRVAALFYLGGMVAYLHREETSPLKLFELGIVAPALITGMLNAGNISIPQGPPSQARASAMVEFAYAQPATDMKKFTLPPESAVQQFFRGLSGAKIENVWFVIAGSHALYDNAVRQARSINERNAGIRAEVYAPYKNGHGYSVVIGVNLTHEQAELLRADAVKKGIAQEIHVWTFPK